MSIANFLDKSSEEGLKSYLKILKILQESSDSSHQRWFNTPSQERFKEASINSEVAAHSIYTLARYDIIKGTTLARGVAQEPTEKESIDAATDEEGPLKAPEIKGQLITDNMFMLENTSDRVDLIFHTSTHLEINSRNFDKLQHRIEKRIGIIVDSRGEQLTWEAISKTLCLGTHCRKLTNQVAVMLFLDVMYENIGNGPIPLAELKEHYERVCKKQKEDPKNKNNSKANYHEKRYLQMTDINFGKLVDYALRGTRKALNLSETASFPIVKTGKGKKAKWQWLDS